MYFLADKSKKNDNFVLKIHLEFYRLSKEIYIEVPGYIILACAMIIMCKLSVILGT